MGGTEHPTAGFSQLELDVEKPAPLQPVEGAPPRRRCARVQRGLTLCAVALVVAAACVGVGAGLGWVSRGSPPPPDDHVSGRAFSKLAFGSCARAELPQPFWRPIAESRPDVFVFAGDIVYGDCEEKSCAPLDEAWSTLGTHPDFAFARASGLPIVGMLDDHDNGRNDAGQSNPFRNYAKAKFLEFFGVPANDVWRRREGLYRSQLYEGRTADGEVRVTQLLLLDVRSARTPAWTAATAPGPGHERYQPEEGVRSLETSMLGARQWAWLEGQLRTPADLRIVVSTIQVFLSGDRHVGALYKYRPENHTSTTAQWRPNQSVLPGGISQPEPAPPSPLASVYELTSSSLTHSFACTAELPCGLEPGPMRTAHPLVHENNWGELSVDWVGRTLALRLRAASEGGGGGRALGDALLEVEVGFDELGMPLLAHELFIHCS
ncbi:hypothetical protein T492DRAFT_843980 [Pavlovales sp. CCMP2436]|nr:hypothetical protein T492DRAFT_843980 [Pavlovales sp. CCMP2436]